MVQNNQNKAMFSYYYLRSTPEISKMSATCKVWLQELDKGREHYKDFNEKNKYTDGDQDL